MSIESESPPWTSALKRSLHHLDLKLPIHEHIHLLEAWFTLKLTAFQYLLSILFIVYQKTKKYFHNLLCLPVWSSKFRLEVGFDYIAIVKRLVITAVFATFIIIAASRLITIIVASITIITIIIATFKM